MRPWRAQACVPWSHLGQVRPQHARWRLLLLPRDPQLGSMGPGSLVFLGNAAFQRDVRHIACSGRSWVRIQVLFREHILYVSGGRGCTGYSHSQVSGVNKFTWHPQPVQHWACCVNKGSESPLFTQPLLLTWIIAMSALDNYSCQVKCRNRLPKLFQPVRNFQCLSLVLVTKN